MKGQPILALSWKNIWRNPVRSSVVMISVILGTWAGVFTSAFMNGLSLQYIQNELQNYTSHLQIHNTEYRQEKLPAYVISDADSIISELQQLDFVLNWTQRSVVQGLAASASNTFGVTIYGIIPNQESEVTTVKNFITAGDYFEQESRNPVLIGNDLAERLNIKMRSRLVLNFQDIEGNLTAGAFRVQGIFNSPNSGFDETNVFVLRDDLNRLLGDDDATHEIAVLVDDFKKADAYRDSLQQSSQIEVESWGDLAPMIRYTDAVMDSVLYVIMIVIIIALIFGIINTMLMAVMERTQELGMLMAIGINKVRIFFMIMLETLFMTMAGVPLGLFMSWLTISWAGSAGINLGAFSKGLEMYGMSSIIFPELSSQYYGNVALLMFFATLFATIYPSLKALKLNPVQAIRKT